MTEKDRELALDEWLRWNPDLCRINGFILREINACAEVIPGRPQKDETAEAYAVRWNGVTAKQDEHRRRVKQLRSEYNALAIKLAAKFRVASQPSGVAGQ